MTRNRPPSAPNGLGPAGRRFWRQIQASFVLDVGETRLLEECCHVVDTLAALQAAIDAAGVMDVGSKVTVPAPLTTRGRNAAAAGGARRPRSASSTGATVARWRNPTPAPSVMPAKLVSFDPADWLLPEDLEVPPGGHWSEPGLRAWRRYRAAKQAWRAEHPESAAG